MSAVPNRQPHNNDEQGQDWPLTPELIGSVLGVDKPKRLLSNKHIAELQRRGKGIREGELRIKISNGKVVAIADLRVHLLDDID